MHKKRLHVLTEKRKTRGLNTRTHTLYTHKYIHKSEASVSGHSLAPELHIGFICHHITLHTLPEWHHGVLWSHLNTESFIYKSYKIHNNIKCAIFLSSTGLICATTTYDFFSLILQYMFLFNFMFWACYHKGGGTHLKGQKTLFCERPILLHKYVQVSMPCLNKIQKQYHLCSSHATVFIHSQAPVSWWAQGASDVKTPPPPSPTVEFNKFYMNCR